MNNKIDPCDTMRVNLIAAAIGLQQCTKTASNIVPIPGGDRVIAIGTPAQMRALLAAEMDERCPHCDGTGEVHRPDGTWAGTCTCPAGAAHPDDLAVDRFAAAMKAKMAQKRADGRGGWNDKNVCSAARLQVMLVEHMGKGDPVDVGNFAMMLWNRGEPVAAPTQAFPNDGREPDWWAYAAAEAKHLPGWERGIATVTMTGHQLREALDFINPGGDDEPDERDDELTFGVVQAKDDTGHASTGLCCWNADSDGVLPLDGYPDASIARPASCAAGRDGECVHAQCPQLRDGEPMKSGRHCPLDNRDEG